MKLQKPQLQKQNKELIKYMTQEQRDIYLKGYEEGWKESAQQHYSIGYREGLKDF